MAKRYFIRKSHGDLVQEQNRLLETLLSKQDGKERIFIQAQPDNKDYVAQKWEQDPTPKTAAEDIDFYFELDDIPYIPTSPKGSAKLQSVETNKVSFDGENVEKLKKTRANKLD